MADDSRLVFALPWLVQQVRDRFEAEGVLIPNAFGWREAARKLEESENRIMWVPGDDSSQVAGDYEAPQSVGENPRALAQLAELCTVYLHAYDDEEPEDELVQYTAVRTLHDVWFRAVHLAAVGTYKLSRPTWHGKPKERRRGATMRVLLSITAPIPDEEQAIVPADAGAIASAHLHAKTDPAPDPDETEPVTTADTAE